MKRFLSLTLLLVIVLSGCSNTQGRDVSVQKSGFDGATIITVPSHGNACTSVICTGLGAQWASNSPDKTLLLVNVFNDIQGIVGAELNIDGAVYNLVKSKQFTNFDSFSPSIKNSEQVFIVPTDLVRKMISSKRTWLRVTTTKGIIEDAVVDGNKDSKAFYALKRFISKIDAEK